MQWVALQPGGKMRLVDPALGLFLGQSLNISRAPVVRGIHDFDRLRLADEENSLKHVNDEIHRRDVIIVDDDAVERFQFRFRNFNSRVVWRETGTWA